MALIQKKNRPTSEDTPLGPPDLKVHDSIAETLRLARKEHGQDLRTVAQVLRIRYAYLEAIEEGDFDALPGIAYAIGFLRTYAEFLGLDGEEIIERYKRESQSGGPKLELTFPEPVGHNRIPGGAIVLIAVVLLGVAYGGWFYLSNQGKDIADLMPALPESLQAMISGGENGQDTVMPGTAPAVPGEPSGASFAGTEATTYMPPESAEAEAESDSAIETADPGMAGDASAPAQLAAPALAALEGVEPVPVFEISRNDAEMPEAAAPEAAEPMLAVPAPSPAPKLAPEVTEAVETAAVEVVKKAETPAETPTPAPAPAQEVAEVAEAAIEPTPRVAAPILPSLIEADISASTREYVPARANHTTQASSVEPMLDETVVIPAPPTSTRDLVLSSIRSPRTYGQNDANTRIVLRAVEDSWVQVRDHQDALLLTRVLRSGDTYYVPDRIGLTLLTGNAGGIAIEVDGVTLAPLGPVGAVRRQIALDPARLLDGTASPR